MCIRHDLDVTFNPLTLALLHTYLNPRLTAASKHQLLHRHIRNTKTFADLAAQACIRLRIAYKRLYRSRPGRRTDLVDRRSVRFCIPSCGENPRPDCPDLSMNRV